MTYGTVINETLLAEYTLPRPRLLAMKRILIPVSVGLLAAARAVTASIVRQCLSPEATRLHVRDPPGPWRGRLSIRCKEE
ncbi:hypothetical protein O3P69_017086 [Scylla paramamosain]|uniref:Uncharacterized protein n=1 Tax=Scylla paramamosain TaxID=85552 RepID=A0AAW0TU61_SCYPA